MEHEIMDEIDEVRKRWDEEIERLDVLEQQKRQQGEDRNESTEFVSLSHSGHT